MAKQTILTGTVANDKTGDTIRAAFIKANANFTELYNLGAAQGVQGIQGIQGVQGITGSQGITGAQGLQGATGSGSQGIQGTAGFVGSNGSQGTQGIEGSQGIQGTEGSGSQGIQGIEGSQGTQGTEGAQGTQGIQGFKPLLNTLFLAGDYYFQAVDSSYNGPSSAGMEWSAGQVLSVWAPDEDGIVQHILITSYNSADGTLVATITDSSNPGYKTQAGVYVSLSGQTGAQGIQGVQGAQGTEGSQGAQGTEGSQGTQGTEGAQGIQGIEGSQGTQGIQGIEGTILNFIGNWVAGTYTPNMIVVSPLNGNTYICIAIPADGGAIYVDPSLNTDAWVLYSSRGVQGTEGIQGAQGIEGSQGTQGIEGSQGTQGTEGSQGIQGIEGSQGTQGTEGSQGIQGIEGSQGTQGTEGSQGIQGIEGSQGITGAQGTRATEDRLINGSYEVILNATGELTFPEGANITDTATTIVITPPGAAAGQSLVIRPTSSTWSVTSSGYIVYGSPITISVNQLSGGAYWGTVNYEITGTGVTQQSLGRALTGNVVFDGTTGPIAETVTWTIPANSSITEFTFTLTTVEGTYQGGSPGDPALHYNFEYNALPAGTFATITNNGINSSEHSHVHLISGNSVTTDIYLGDDDQFVKIEKNGGNVVIGTNTNTKNWTFRTTGKASLPAVSWNYLPTTFTAVPVTYGATTLTFTVLPDNTILDMSVAAGAGGYGPDDYDLTIPGTTFPGGATPANDIVFNVQTFESAGPVYSTDVTSTVTYVSGTPPLRYDNIAATGDLGLGAGNAHWVFKTNGASVYPTDGIPTTSKGVAGDAIGSVVFGSGYIYYCFDTYSDGTNDIWKRIAWSNDTW
jgi:hypothetical protein